MADGFLERLRSGPPIVADGGMGVVVGAAVAGLRCPEEANLRAPDVVTSAHVGFVNAGAELIETNTFGASRRKLAQHYLDDRFEEINSAAVKLAREAREITGREVWIGGSIGPAGGHDGAPFAEQARILAGRGADLFLLETFSDLEELELAVEAVRSVSGLPIVALLSFDSDAVTMGGVSARDAADRLARLDLAAFGANHGRGPAAALAALEQMAGHRPLAALPNVGLATWTGSRVSFPHATPEYFAEFAARARALGAQLIGGCCGTTPAQIAAMRGAIDANRKAAAPARPSEPLPLDVPGSAEEPTELARLLAAGEFVVSVQLDPPLGGSADGLVDTARRIRESGLAQLVDVNDNPRAHERAARVGRGPPGDRDRGRAASDAPGLDARGARVAAARRPRGGGAQRAGRHRRRSRVGRLPGRRRGVRRGRDRPRRADGAPERGHRFSRAGDRRADGVLPGCRGQSDRRGPRPRGGSLRPQARGGRAVRDDAGPVRRVVPRPVPGARRRLAGSAAARRLADPVVRACGARAQRDARDRGSGQRAAALPRRGRRRRACGRRARARAGRGGAPARRRRV